MKLTADDRQEIDRAREVSAELRVSDSNRDRLAGLLLASLADMAERLATP